MNEEKPMSTFLADYTKSESFKVSSCIENSKEKCELMYEIKTICKLDSLMSSELPPNNEVHCKKYTVEVDSKLFLLNNSETIPNDCISSTYAPIKTIANSDSVPKPLTCVHANDSQKEIMLSSKNNIEEASHCKESVCNSSNIDENSNGENDCQHSYSSDINLYDDAKRTSRRSLKRKKDSEKCCPICGVTVRLNDLESHYSQEVERLTKLSRGSKRQHMEETSKNEAFQRIKLNRESRLTARVARYSARAKNEVKCPVCSLRMSGTAEEINKHVAFCIQDEDTDVDVDGDDADGNESFEEYEIGDETRIRPISLVPGGYRSLQGASTLQATEDEDLNVDVDDTLTYGDAQYSEVDVIPDITSEKDREDLELLRNAVATNACVRPQNLECHKWSKKETEQPELPKGVSDVDPVISSLREKIKAFEDQDKSVRCLICLEAYTKPVVSTTCWHVHCEECWLMTMGVKKLCPQCNMIVFPSDLRKIYL